MSKSHDETLQKILRLYEKNWLSVSHDYDKTPELSNDIREFTIQHLIKNHSTYTVLHYIFLYKIH